MLLAETNSPRMGEPRTPRFIGSMAADGSYVAKGRGVIATPNGYQQAGDIEEFIPAPQDLQGLPLEVIAYRLLPPESPAAIYMRQKAAAQLALRDLVEPLIVRGEE